MKVAAPPAEGKANAELLASLAGLLGVPKSSVRVTRGATARNKTVRVDGLSTDHALALLSAASGGEQGRLDV